MPFDKSMIYHCLHNSLPITLLFDCSFVYNNFYLLKEQIEIGHKFYHLTRSSPIYYNINQKYMYIRARIIDKHICMHIYSMVQKILFLSRIVVVDPTSVLACQSTSIYDAKKRLELFINVNTSLKLPYKFLLIGACLRMSPEVHQYCLLYQ